MNRALAYGLMGAASGALHGLYDEWQQNQEDIRSEKLMRAKLLEQQQLARMTARYNSAVNLQKIMAQTQADMKRDAANNQAKVDLQTQKDQADAQQAALDRASREQVAAANDATTLKAANIRAANDGAVKPRLVAVKDKAGNITFQAAQPGDSLPAGSSLTGLSGDPRFAPLPVGMLGNFGAPGAGNDSGDAAPSSDSAVAKPAPAVTQPGSSSLNPVDASSLGSAPPLGTWVKLPDGSVKQYRGPGA